MDLANKSVVLYQNVKIKTEWKFQEVVDDLLRFSKWPLYVSWYDGSKKRMEPAGRDSDHALKMLNKKRLELAYKGAGGEIKENDEVVDQPDLMGWTRLVSPSCYARDEEEEPWCRQQRLGWILRSRFFRCMVPTGSARRFYVAS
jgi:hypothetical protein